MATREQLESNPYACLYNDPKRGIIMSEREAFSSPDWFRDRKNTTKSSGSLALKCEGKVYSEKVGNKTVCSTEKPFSSPRWFKHARQQGVTKYDGY